MAAAAPAMPPAPAPVAAGPPASGGGGRGRSSTRASRASVAEAAVGGGATASAYDPTVRPSFAVTVDVVVFTLIDGHLSTLLVRRGEPPFEGRWALPGGFVRPDESLEQAAARELREETGVEAAAYLEQLGTYGDPDRDPRMRVVSVAYLAVVGHVGTVVAGSDAAVAELVPVAEIVDRQVDRLAFDHHQILDDALETVRARLEDTPLATAFVGPEFTISELRTVYESAWDTELDPGNFRRKILSEPDLVEPTGNTRPPGPEGGKPPETYRYASAPMLSSPIARPKPKKVD
jgi:8-oxo-dGTP diphosphatase